MRESNIDKQTSAKIQEPFMKVLESSMKGFQNLESTKKQYPLRFSLKFKLILQTNN